MRLEPSEPKGPVLTSAVVPQANDPHRVIQLVELVAAGIQPSPARLGVHSRQIDYYLTAARMLGFMRGKAVTPAGRGLAMLDAEARLGRFSVAFAESIVGRAWARWAGARTVLNVDPDSAGKFLRAASDIDPDVSTFPRRVSTMRAWHRLATVHHPSRVSREATLPPVGDLEDFEDVAIFERRESAALIRQHAPGTAHLRVATAFLTVQGYDLVADRLRSSVMSILVGFEDAVFAVQQVLDYFRRDIATGKPTPEKRRAMFDFYRELVTGSARVRIADARFKDRVHAKIYIFDRRLVFVTSANMTHGGLRSNVEGGTTHTKPKLVEDFIAKFDEHFLDAEELVPTLLDPIERSWAFADPAEPFIAYLRVLLELFPEPPALDGRAKYSLAAFQRMIVGSVCACLKDGRAALLVAPTGTGKTIMAAHTALALSASHEIDRVMVLCPNQTLREMWTKTFREYGLAADVITHGILQEKGAPSEAKERRLREILDNVRDGDLLIVDEAHHFRNPESTGFENVNALMQSTLDRANPRRLLLTATPFSKGLDDLNTLVRLVSDKPLATPLEIAEHPSIVNVTLPFIASKFGTTNGNRVLLSFGNEERSFPFIRMRTESYQSPMEAAFAFIGEMDLSVHQVRAARRPQLPLFDPSLVELASSAGYSSLLRLGLALGAESSPAALLARLERLREQLAAGGIEPTDPDGFAAQLDALRALVPTHQDDSKLQALLAIVASRGPREKILVFTSSVPTATYLATHLGRRFTDRRVESIDGTMSTSARRSALQRFAPEAQDRGRRRRRDDIDILVATDCIAEGENLQDAVVLINFDLYWTPLRLIQRVGRVDRPTVRHREVDIVNFYPSGSVFDRLVSLRPRLEERAELHASIAKTRVLGDEERDLCAVDADDLGLVRMVYAVADYARIVDALLPTSKHLVDRANATPAQIAAASDLEIGARSAKHGDEAGTFALLRHEGALHCVFKAAPGGIISSPETATHEAMLRHVACAPETPRATLPPDMDQHLAVLVDEWASARSVEPEDVTIIVAVAVIHEVSASRPPPPS